MFYWKQNTKQDILYIAEPKEEIMPFLKQFDLYMKSKSSKSLIRSFKEKKIFFQYFVSHFLKRKNNKKTKINNDNNNNSNNNNKN